MKLALCLPDVGDSITVSEIVDLTRESEELSFSGMPTAKTIGDMRRLVDDILPRV